MKKNILTALLLTITACSTVYANTALVDLQYFAESYEPKSQEYSVIPAVPEPTLAVKSAIEYMKNMKSRDHEKFVILIFLKLYRFHFENFHQSYDLREKGGLVNNLLLAEFCRLGDFNCINKEFMPSVIALEWMKTPRPYKKYEKIIIEIERIEKAKGEQ